MDRRVTRLLIFSVFFFQAEDGIRDLVRSRGLGDVYKRQAMPARRCSPSSPPSSPPGCLPGLPTTALRRSERFCASLPSSCCLLYTSDAADERSSVDLGGRRILKKKKNHKKKKTKKQHTTTQHTPQDDENNRETEHMS